MTGYTPKSDEQLALEGLLPDGEYDFSVVETSDKSSKAGNFMITLGLHVFGADGSTQYVKDYIVPSSNYGERKLRHAADACGLIPIYEAGNLRDTDFLGKSGRVKLKIQEGKDGYGPKNIVGNYIKRSAPSSENSQSVAAQAPLDDTIPF